MARKQRVQHSSRLRVHSAWQQQGGACVLTLVAAADCPGENQHAAAVQVHAAH